MKAATKQLDNTSGKGAMAWLAHAVSKALPEKQQAGNKPTGAYGEATDALGVGGPNWHSEQPGGGDHGM